MGEGRPVQTMVIEWTISRLGDNNNWGTMQEQDNVLPCVIKSEVILNAIDYFSKVINALF